MTINYEQLLNEARSELSRKVEKANQLDREKSELVLEIVRLDERVKLYTEMIKDKNQA